MTALFRPALDVVENENSVTVHINVPGIPAESIDIRVEGDMLTISGEKTAPEGERFLYRERRTGAFKRSLRLAETLDTEHIDATYSNGVLSLVLPKRPETQPRRIDVVTA